MTKPEPAAVPLPQGAGYARWCVLVGSDGGVYLNAGDDTAARWIAWLDLTAEQRREAAESQNWPKAAPKPVNG